MRFLLLVLVGAACAKKPAPKAATPPPPAETMNADAPGDPAGDKGAEDAKGDPCDGGETKTK